MTITTQTRARVAAILIAAGLFALAVPSCATPSEDDTHEPTPVVAPTR